MRRPMLALACALSTLLPLAFCAPAAAQTPPPAAQPMRFVLVDGTAVIGTQIGGDTEFVFVQTASGAVRVPRASIASVDYQTGQGSVVVAAPQPGAPPGYVAQPARPPRRPGRGLILAGSIVFGISYGLSLVVATSAGMESPSALWFFMPVMGPALWAATVDCGSDWGHSLCRSMAVMLGGFVSLVQTTGVVLLVVGLSQRAGADDAQATLERRLARARPRIDFGPLLAPGLAGLTVRLDM